MELRWALAEDLGESVAGWVGVHGWSGWGGVGWVYWKIFMGGLRGGGRPRLKRDRRGDLLKVVFFWGSEGVYLGKKFK